jgi:hypothetical protein
LNQGRKEKNQARSQGRKEKKTRKREKHEKIEKRENEKKLFSKQSGKHIKLPHLSMSCVSVFLYGKSYNLSRKNEFLTGKTSNFFRGPAAPNPLLVSFESPSATQSTSHDKEVARL